MRLKQLQTFLYRHIAAPEHQSRSQGDTPGAPFPALEAVIRSEDGLSATQRIQIYADAYFQRVLECLEEDFPATLAIVGEDEFREITRVYLDRHPPTEPSIDWAGRHFGAFLRGQSVLARFPFLADLARLEWAISEISVAPDCASLTAAELQNVPLEHWPSLTLRAIPASQILPCDWLVCDLRSAIQADRQWNAPPRGAVAALVWRTAGQVYFREPEAAEQLALELLSGGVTFAALCERLSVKLADENPAPAINQMLAGWIADGLLAAPAAAGSPAP